MSDNEKEEADALTKVLEAAYERAWSWLKTDPEGRVQILASYKRLQVALESMLTVPWGPDTFAAAKEAS